MPRNFLKALYKYCEINFLFEYYNNTYPTDQKAEEIYNKKDFLVSETNSENSQNDNSSESKFTTISQTGNRQHTGSQNGKRVKIIDHIENMIINEDNSQQSA
ncbi:590_t:CDS:2 [Ambispora leptoticha]|uniref:590_t:CDS:1 n=1 Tax=Ambispora leptoticha TaxID=144679 RepID=A0A9N9AV06_9GLOM|nr:590_t:CDS:2 [Ambispora leptoticha]